MKHYSHGIDGLRSGLSPSAKPFAIGSSSSPSFSLKSEHEDSIWGDYTLDLSFLSSDDQRSGLDDDDSLSNLSRDVETTKEGLVLEEKIASSRKVLVNPNPVFSKLPEVLIKSSNVAGDAKLGMSCVSEKSSTESDEDDSEEDSPCWIGMHSHKSLASGAKAVASRRSTDDLSGFHRLNPLAPQFIPSNSKKKVETDGEKCEENSSSSLKKSLSSTFPSSSGEFDLTDPPPEDGRNDAAKLTSILTHNADEIFGFVSSDSVSKTVSMLDSRNEFQPSKRLDPLAPVFVPSSAKLSPSVHEKQGAFEANAHSTSALTSSDDKSLNKVKVATSSGEVVHSFKCRYGGNVLSSTSSYSPWIESDVGITEYAKLGSSSNKSQGQRRLNPLARQFSLADTKPKAYDYEKNQAADDLSLVVNTTGLYIPDRYREDHNVVDADLAQSSVYVERFIPNMSHGSSSLISPKADSNIGSTKWFAVEPNPTFSVKGNRDLKHPLPFHVVDTAASSSTSAMKALPGPSPKMDVKKLLTTMHGLSELLTLAHGSESSDSPNAEELDLINSTVQNLNLYIQNNTQAGNQSVAQRNSYDLKLLPNKSKLSIRDTHQLPTANNMTVDLDVKRKDKYSVVSRETIPGSRSYQYGVTKDNSFGQVVPTNGYQQNYQGEEQINQNALFYKSLWLKAEADRCLMVYETSLSNPYP
ncbi:hypothetical protein ISN45_Aa01g025250 [Arabidopsis thaliana x Arabidopsis arenosa]|uniref:Uncharacterized protein n=1 Tax=Arabidopsis thaliana x Arabidopsis arenosa TaxID=1240361 RepID=A0A8T2CER1_9BRAS|nr:hypothetical protein ISN45_Aa01g025250 [Arabidopsis thaliana x Arabidopsis arenosa]